MSSCQKLLKLVVHASGRQIPLSRTTVTGSHTCFRFSRIRSNKNHLIFIIVFISVSFNVRVFGLIVLRQLFSDFMVQPF